MENNSSTNYGTARFRKYYSRVRKWSEKTGVQKALTLALSFFLVAFFISFALRPTLTKISELRVEIDESQETLEKLQQKSETLERIAGMWDQVTPYLPALRNSIPIGPEYRTFVKEMEVLAGRHNVTYLNGNFGDSIVASQVLDPYDLGGSLSAVPITVSFRLNGNWEDIKALLSDMVGFDRVIDFKSLGITNNSGRRSGDSEDKVVGALDVNITGDFYYFGDKSAIYKILGVTK